MRDPYEILQVSRNAEIEVIEAAYRRLARKYHPDANPSQDATERMKDINWAYEVLSDPIKRQSFDRRETSYRPTSSYDSTRSYDQRRQPRSPPPPRASDFGTSHATATSKSTPPKLIQGQTFLQKYWYLIVIAVGISLYFFPPKTRSSSSDSIISASERSSSTVVTEDPYEDCIDWTMAHLYDGQRKCVIGRMILVSYEFDPTSGSDIWTGYFSMDEDRGFRIISVDHDISEWQNQCVIVYGTLFDRDLIREYVHDPAPSMVDSDPYDDRGFSISAAPAMKCR